MKKTYEQLKEKYLENCLASAKKIDYINCAQLRRHNKAVDGYIKYARLIFEGYPEKSEDFALLMDDINPNIRIPTAAFILEYVHSSMQQKRKAIATIKEMMPYMNRVDQCGFSILLEQNKLE